MVETEVVSLEWVLVSVLVDGLKANNRIRFYVNNPLHKDLCHFYFTSCVLLLLRYRIHHLLRQVTANNILVQTQRIEKKLVNKRKVNIKPKWMMTIHVIYKRLLGWVKFNCEREEMREVWCVFVGKCIRSA